MNKKVIIVIVVIFVIALVGLGGYFLLGSKDKTNESKKNSSNTPVVNENNEKEVKSPTSNDKTLVVYYSATGSTKNVAEQIANNLNADLFEIEPVDVYTGADLNWNDSNSRVSREHNDESLRDVKLKTTKVNNWDNYDTILIGYPIWWGIAAWPVDTFVTANDFNDKTVIPFCTSASSGLGQSGELLKAKANGGNWLEGQRFSSGASSSDIKTWTDSFK